MVKMANRLVQVSRNVRLDEEGLKAYVLNLQRQLRDLQTKWPGMEEKQE